MFQEATCLNQREVDHILDQTLIPIPLALDYSLEDFNNELRKMRPHKPHDACSDECRLAIDREITGFLWNAYYVGARAK